MYRETLSNFGPALVGDAIVLGHIEAGNRLVDLQETGRKETVRGGMLTRPKTHVVCT